MDKKEFAAQLTQRLEKIPADQHDWYEALMCAALDETRGHLGEALKRADAAFAEDPTGEIP